MNADIKDKWVKALRSGEYKQGQGVLRNLEDKYCCLGVLCDLYAKENGKVWKKTESMGHGEVLEMEGSYTFPSKEVIQWSGLPDRNPSVKVHDSIIMPNDSLATLNDFGGKSFLEIADLIEKQL